MAPPLKYVSKSHRTGVICIVLLKGPWSISQITHPTRPNYLYYTIMILFICLTKRIIFASHSLLIKTAARHSASTQNNRRNMTNLNKTFIYYPRIYGTCKKKMCALVHIGYEYMYIIFCCRWIGLGWCTRLIACMHS